MEIYIPVGLLETQPRLSLWELSPRASAAFSEGLEEPFCITHGPVCFEHRGQEERIEARVSSAGWGIKSFL